MLCDLIWRVIEIYDFIPMRNSIIIFFKQNINIIDFSYLNLG